MHWVWVAIAAFMTIISLANTRNGSAYFMRGLAWACLLYYMFSHESWLIYAIIMLFVISLFMPKKPTVVEQPSVPDIDDASADGEKIPYPYFPAPATLSCQVIQREIEVPLEIESESSFDTAANGTLTIAPGTYKIRVGMTILYDDPGTDDFPIDTIAITHKITDNQGHEWQTDVVASANLLTDIFIGRLEQLDASGDIIMHREETAPQNWREIITKSALLTKIRDLIDDRSYYYITVDDQLLILQGKYQMPHFDLGWLPTESLFLVRVTGLYDNMHADADADPANHEIPMLAPLYFTVNPSELLLQTTDSYKDADGTEHDEDDPFVITFHSTGQLAPANSGVSIS